MRRSFFSINHNNSHAFCHSTTTSGFLIAAQQLQTNFSRFFSSSSSSSASYKNNFRRITSPSCSLPSHSTIATPPLLFSAHRHQSGSSSEDYYSLLGVTPSASTGDIKSAYKKQALKFHPDRNKDPGAEDKFKKISEAYSILSNDEKKRAYDGMRSYSSGGGGGMGMGQGHYAGAGGGFGSGGNPRRTYPAGGGPMPGMSSGPASYGAYGSSGGRATNSSSGGGGGQGNMNPFFVHTMSKEEADRIFQSIFGGGPVGGTGGGAGGRTGNPMDDIFGRPGTHPSQTGYSFGGGGNGNGNFGRGASYQIPPGAVLESKSTFRNADGSFQRDEIYRLPDGKVMRISHVYDKSGQTKDTSSTSTTSSAFQQDQQNYDPNQNINFPHNPFSTAGNPQQQGNGGGFGNFGNSGGMPGSGFGSQSQAYSNPFSSAFNSGSNIGSGASSGSSNPFSAFSSSFASGGRRPGTGSAFAGGSSTNRSPFSGFFRQGSNNSMPFTGVWGSSPGLRLFVVWLLIGFVIASMFSFTLQHPMFFLFIVFMFLMSRRGRFF